MDIRGTTILGIIKDGKAVIGGDGQVTFGHTVLKSNAVKIRKLYYDRIIAGFAGATADAFTLFEKFDIKLKEYKGNLKKSAVELAKDWRSDKILRRLEAMIIVADKETILILTGNGDVVEPNDGIAAIGSGGSYALASAKALTMKNPNLDLKEIVEVSLNIASDICIYTNNNIVIEEI